MNEKNKKRNFIQALKCMEHDEFRNSVVEGIIAMGRGAFTSWISALVNAGVHVPKIEKK